MACCKPALHPATKNADETSNKLRISPSGELMAVTSSNEFALSRGLKQFGEKMPQAFVFISGFLATIGAPAFLQSALGWLAIGSSTMLGGALLSVGLSFGLSYLSLALNKPKTPKPEDVQNNIRNAISPRVRHYGREKVGGTIIFIESKDGNLHKVMAMGHGQADAIEEYWVDSQLVTPSSDGWVRQKPWDQGNGLSLRIHTRIGLPTETPYEGMRSAFPEWTANHRGDGILSLYAYQGAVKADQFQERFPNGTGTIYRLVIRGSRVYDPNAGGQLITDETTWNWSDNLARIALDYMHHRDGMRIPLSLLTTPLAMAGWRQAVNDCNDPIPLKGGGTEPRYRAWGSYTLEERPADVLNRILVSAEARLVPTPDGGLTIDVGKWNAPTVTIDSSCIISFDGVGRGRDIRNTANIINAIYTSPAHDYQSTDAQPWQDDEDVSQRGEIATAVEFIMSPSHSQCRRLMKITAYDANPSWVGTFVLNLKGLRIIGERVIRIVYPEFGIDAFFKIKDARFLIGEGAALIGVQVDVTSTTELAYQWNAAVDEGTAPAADDVTVDRDVPLPSNFAVVIERQNIGGTTIAVAKATWNTPSSNALQMQVQFKRHSEAEWTDFNVNQDETFSRTGALLDGEDYDFRARYRTLAGRTGDWTSIITLTAIADTTAPGVVTSPNATVDGGNVVLTYQTPNSGNYRAANVYRSETNSFGTAELIATKWGAPSSVDLYTDATVTTGTYYYWIKARNGSGIESAATAFGEVIVP